jgi:hypothetical protein
MKVKLNIHSFINEAINGITKWDPNTAKGTYHIYPGRGVKDLKQGTWDNLFDYDFDLEPKDDGITCPWGAYVSVKGGNIVISGEPAPGSHYGSVDITVAPDVFNRLYNMSFHIQNIDDAETFETIFNELIANSWQVVRG